jgi:hypothetical protein
VTGSRVAAEKIRRSSGVSARAVAKSFMSQWWPARAAAMLASVGAQDAVDRALVAQRGGEAIGQPRAGLQPEAESHAPQRVRGQGGVTHEGDLPRGRGARRVWHGELADEGRHPAGPGERRGVGEAGEGGREARVEVALELRRAPSGGHDGQHGERAPSGAGCSRTRTPRAGSSPSASRRRCGCARRPPPPSPR